ncbi:alpha/beta fold hydrolase [Streptococcus dentapri]|uniref:Alpha/beta fold hydrolase n=1 Tax=Streptococcus dentapri TaxID=573564 RepID=A0ABV8CZU2_9STRE
MKQLFVKEIGQQNAQTIVFLHASGSSSDVEWTSFDDVTEMIVKIIKSRAHGKPHLVGLSLGGSLILKLLESHSDAVDRVIVDGACHHPIKGYRKVIAMVYVMSLFKNTKIVAHLMTKMMQDDGASEEDCRGFVADLQRASSKSFHRVMSQANVLNVGLSFANPAFFVSGGEESETIHQSHQLLAGRNINSESAYYPNKGHAWLFSDVDTHIQLVRYFLQGATFPYQLSRLTY